MATKIMLTNVRCAFLTLGEPEDYQGNKKFRWSATALVPYDSPLKKQIDAALLAIAKEKWGAKGQAYHDNILADPKACCWNDGKKKPDYDGFAGHFALAAHRPQDKGRPLVLDNDKSPIYKPDNSLYDGKAGRVYSGCFVNMQVELYTSDKPNMGLRCGLLGIQRAKDGDAFGGGAAPSADEFGEISDGADSDDLS